MQPHTGGLGNFSKTLNNIREETSLKMMYYRDVNEMVESLLHNEYSNT